MAPFRSADLIERIRKATDLIPSAHRLAPVDGETFSTLEQAVKRLQDYAFTQGFALVIETRDLKRNRLVMECIRHKDKYKNVRKLTSDERKRSTKVSYLGCKYRVSVRIGRHDTELTLAISNDSHDHDSAYDPFAFKVHNDKDPDRETALNLGTSLRASAIPYIQATRVLANQDLRLTRSDFYNLQRSEGKLTSEEELLGALGHLEDRGFHVLTKEVYLVEQNERRRRVIEMFFFCSPEQIAMGRRFVSSFVMQTDATFNTNELNLPLSVLIGVTNISKSFPMAYCFIPSESAAAFKFMNRCMRTLFFYDDCPGPRVVMGDFAAGLTATFLKEQQLTLSEAGMAVCFELSAEAELDECGSEVTLQLCSWHAVEAMKKRLINEGYPKEKRKELVDAIWHWIHCPTEDLLRARRNSVIELLREKERDYLTSFYQRKERQFVHCFIKKLPNLGAESTQRVESSHLAAKRITNRHTPIQQSVQRICAEVNRLTLAHETDINNQRRKLPGLMNRSAFGGVLTLITHQAIEMLEREWNAASKWDLDLTDDDADEVLSAPNAPEEGCQLSCSLPLRYGLPCKCWLFQCVRMELPIPISLIHPRWLYDGPDYVANWSMSFDPDLDPSEYAQKVAESNEADNSSRGDRFARRGANLIEASALKAIDLHRSIPQGHRAEEYARGIAKYTERWLEDDANRQHIPQTFPDAIKPKANLTFSKKGGSRRRAYTGREAAEAAEVAERRNTRKLELEAQRIAKWNAVGSQFWQRNFPDEAPPEASGGPSEGASGDASGDDFGDDLPSDGADDSELEVAGPSRRQRHSPITDDQFDASVDMIPSTFAIENNNSANLSAKNPVMISSDDESSSSNEPSSDELPDVNELIQSQQPSPLFSESQLKPTASQVAPKSSATTTRSTRGVPKKKTWNQQRWESQEAAEAQRKAQNKAKRVAAAARKQAKLLEPRKEDVSQLEEDFALLRSSE